MAMQGAPALGAQAVTVGVATRGRARHVRLVVEEIRKQTLRPTLILVAYAEPSDVEGLVPAADLKLIPAPPGLTRQRNAILDRLPAACEMVVFFDDDFFPQREWLARAAAQIRDDAGIVGLTGTVILNGVKTGEIDVSRAHAAIAAAPPPARACVEEGVSPYGCNMAFRRSAIGALRFDEELVHYCWLEDLDFAARVAAGGGRLVRTDDALGVHLAVGAGRMPDRRLGYAQIANPLHLLKRRTMTLRDFGRRVATDLASNLLKSPGLPARRRRLAGNVVAIAEALVGRCAPERAARL